MNSTHDNEGRPLFSFEVSLADMQEPFAVEFRRKRALIAYARSGGAGSLLRLAKERPKGVISKSFVDEAIEAEKLLREAK